MFREELRLCLFFDMCQGSRLSTFSWAPHGSRDDACCCCYSGCCCCLSLGPCLLGSGLDICEGSGSCVPSTTDSCTRGCSRLWFGDWLALDNKRRPNFGKLDLQEGENRRIKCLVHDHRGDRWHVTMQWRRVVHFLIM